MAYIKQLGFLLLLMVANFVYAHSVPLKDKIGQMLILGFEGKTFNQSMAITHAIQHNNLGGVILFDLNAHTGLHKNIENPAQVEQLNRALQKAAELGNKTHHREKLPLLISVDYEGGEVTRLNAQYGFPKTLAAETVANLPLAKARKQADMMAKTLKNNGFNLDFAPLVDVNNNPANPIIAGKKRSFSAMPKIVTTYADIYTNAFLRQDIQCAYKHFPGHGSSTADSHLGFVDVTHTWQKNELIPYRQLFAKPTHCGMVMSAHIVNRQLDPSGLPATLSHRMLTGILRHELKFNGVIITDDMQMNAIAKRYSLETAVTKAINAGADMLLFGNQLQKEKVTASQLIALIEKQVRDGAISEARIDEAYERIRYLKGSLN